MYNDFIVWQIQEPESVSSEESPGPIIAAAAGVKKVHGMVLNVP